MAHHDEEHDAPTLADNPGLEHDAATEEGLLMTGLGSVGEVTRRPLRGHDADPDLADNPGLEHDAATSEGKMMTGSGSVGPDEEDEQARRRTTAEDETT